jgi:hypothetical protein
VTTIQPIETPAPPTLLQAAESRDVYYNSIAIGGSEFALDAEGCITDPGKFEGEAAYVPYFYLLDAGELIGTEAHPRYRYTVTADDRRIFPNLSGRRTVILKEADDGFVVEVATS